MKPICVLVAISLLAMVFVTGCTTEQEKQEGVWGSFVEAVSEKRVEDALGYVDFARMAQKTADDSPEWTLAVGLWGKTEEAAKFMEGLLRDALAKGEIQEGKPAAEFKKPKTVTTEGGHCTMLFIGSASGEMTVEMERIDGEWKIVGFK